MDYEQKFYESIEKRKNKIKSLDISDDEKNNLYKLVDESIQIYEENKTNRLEREENLVRLVKAWEDISRGLKKITSITKDTLSNLEDTVAKKRIEEKIFPQDNFPFSNN